MANTTINVAAFEEACAEVADAIESSDWSTAQCKCLKAEAILAGLPAHVGTADAFVRYRETLSHLRKSIDEAQGSISRHSDRSRFARTRVGYGT